MIDGDIEIGSQQVESSAAVGNKRAISTSIAASTSIVSPYPPLLGMVIVSIEFLHRQYELVECHTHTDT